MVVFNTLYACLKLADVSENLTFDLKQPNDLGNERENERNIEEQQNESDNEEEKDVDEKSSSSKHSWGSTSDISSHVRSKYRLLIDENDNSNKNKKQITLQESLQNSAEIMTSSNSISFLDITAHWISDEWELKNILLDFVKLEGSHSGKNIKEFFLKSLKDFGIMTKILSITTDNASNNNTFLEEVSNELAEKNIEFDNVNQHVRCLAHIINLAAQEALKSLKATVNISEDEFLNQHENIQNNNNQVEVVGSILCKLRTLICKIRASPQQREKFSAQCKVADIPDKMVILDVRTRWNSTFDMLVRARELKEPLNTLSNSDINLRSFILNEKEWECLAEIELILKGFSKATKQICAETYPTIAYVIPYYNILLSRLEDFRDSPGRCKEGKEAASNAIRKLLEYYDKTDTSIYTISLGNRAPALSDTLNWWKRHKEEFSNLANMAKDYLGIPATSVPSERVFSSAADVVTSDRARLAPETIRAIMCLKHWYRSGILD
ncbi:zinc finger BED domain-containing protein RICESLEEPER 2-like [Rhizophagus irregularis DAOM 181602=DAOM 197198]|nr:zinc finger BED domain-containing protein RICESLEEPER 2-like [Rhizophagus irregularis DAOM 181602=DAOM 197198]